MLAEKRRSKVTDDPEDFKATIAEHLDELRSRILYSAIALTIGSVIGWVLFIPMLNVLSAVVNKAVKDTRVPLKLEYIDGFSGPFMLHLKMAMYIGLILAIPYIVYQLWMFIRPGLKVSERRPFRIVVPISLGLFFVGVGIGWLTLYPTVAWFLTFSAETPGWSIIQSPSGLIMFGLKLMLAFGVSFQLPLVVYFLASIGIISPDFLWKYWKHSAIAVFTIASLITPTADPFSTLALAIPLTLLFFASVAAAKFSANRRRAKEQSDLDNLD